MNLLYKKFIENIKLSPAQIEDGRTKYKGVCDCLAKEFYGRGLHDNDKLVFGSFKNRTQVLPMGENQDVDVIFKISEETYETYKTRPGAILQYARTILQKKYTATDHISAWGKVVLVDFAKGHHDVEVAPCYETNDGIFLIPNNYKGEVDWEEFDVRGQIDKFKKSNENSCELTRNLVMIVKKWVRNTSSLKYSSYNVTEDVISFVNSFYPKGIESNRYDVIVKDFFTYLLNNLPDHLISYKSNIETAKNRAINAYQFEENGKHIEASEECIKIFGDDFPKAESNTNTERKCDTVIPVRPWAQN